MPKRVTLGDSFTLSGGEAGQSSAPPITRTTHALPFDELSPRDFERLCLWLVQREGYERAEHLGAAGGEQGRDVVAWREGARWAFQCKRVRRFGPRDALAEVDKVLALPEDQRPAGLIFLVTCDVSARTRRQARARCAEKEMECLFWTGSELDEKVKRHPNIVQEFFEAGRGGTTQVIKVKDGTATGITQVAGDYYAAPPAPTPSTAPAPPAHFTGRQAELDALAGALTAGDAPQAITALQGMGGIGKTALAAQLAAQLDGAFPGGVFWADLPANDGDPLPVLAAWARLCGHDVSALPDPQARAQAVRGVLAGRVAEQGRLLVVLDDVRGGWLDGARALASARPPGVPLLMTTRQARVAQALRARITRIDVLSPGEAHALLATLTGDALTGDDAARVAGLCGRLPLALELAAAAVVQEGTAWLLARLSDARARLEALKLDDARGKEESVRLTFDVSYRALAEGHPRTARAFRCLGAFAPAPVSPVRLAGVLAESEKSDEQRELERKKLELLGEVPGGGDVEPAQVEAADTHLRRLTRWALLRRQTSDHPSNLHPSYSLHPLLRDYAAALLEEAGEGPATRAAHTAHYLAYAWGHRQPTAADYDALEAERADILAAMERAYQGEQWTQVRRFAWALCDPASGYLGVRGYWGELRTRLEQAIRAAEAEGHRHDAAAFAGNLATLLKNTGDLAAARREYRRVLAIFEELGERETVAVIYHQLGMLAQETGDYPEARRLYRQSLDINEELGNRAGVAITLHQLGVLAQDTGDYPEARRLYRQSLEVEEELGNRAGIASSLHELGRLAQATGDYPEARRLYRQSLDIAEELGNRAGVAITLHQLGVLAQDTGDYPEARRLYRQSLEVEEELGNRAGIASSLGQLANLADDEGDQAEAERLYRRSWAIAEEIGDVVRASIQMFNLALLCEAQGRLDEALPLLEQAVEIAEQVGMPQAENRRRVLERVRGKLGR